MSFKLVCPKCGSTNVSVERDHRAYAPRFDPADLIMSCRCGKQLFGPQVTQEIDRQRAVYEASEKVRQEAQRQREAKAREEQHREELIRQARMQVAMARRRDEEENRRRREEENRAWIERVEPAAAKKREPARASRERLLRPEPPATGRVHVHPVVDADAPPALTSGEKCAWHMCANPRRDGSMYCSRDCSNKNARYRHAQRKRGDNDAELAENK